LWIASRDPRTPWYAKAALGLVLAYTFSPIDLIPDFVPVFGYLDDLILVPLGIMLVVKMIPEPVMDDARRRALELEHKPVSRAGAVLIVALWVVLLLLLVWMILRLSQK